MDKIINTLNNYVLPFSSKRIWIGIILAVLSILIINVFILIFVKPKGTPYHALAIIVAVVYGIIILINLIYTINKIIKDTEKNSKFKIIGSGVLLILVGIISILPIIFIILPDIGYNILAVIIFVVILGFFLASLISFSNAKICGNSKFRILSVFCKFYNDPGVISSTSSSPPSASGKKK